MFALILDGVVMHIWDIGKLPPMNKKLLDKYEPIPLGADVREHDLFDGAVFSRPPVVAMPYTELRRKEYPSVGDQLSVIAAQLAENRTDGIPLLPKTIAMLDNIQAVKLKYPKTDGA